MRAWATLASLLLFFLPFELLLRATDLDLKLLAPTLYYQGADLPVHAPRADARLYGLRPGYAGDLLGRRITINSLGFRGPERSAAKPGGVFRVLCYGSSNTYGAYVDDDETWPAYLEKELSARLKRPVEAWNGGVSAYSLRQMVWAASEGLERYQPDLILIQPYYWGRRPFLLGAPLAPAFAADPSLLAENLWWLPFGGQPLDTALLRWRTWRLLVILANVRGAPRNNPAYDSKEPETPSLSRLVASSKVPVVLVIPPPAEVSPEILSGAERSLIIRLRDLLPRGAGEDYQLIHPPAEVYAWYGRTIAGQLAKRGLLPRAPKGR